MNYLLFFISAIFSLIFYIFHLSSVGGSFLGFNFEPKLSLELISGNLLVETTVFLLIAIFLFLGFSNYEIKKTNKKIDFSGFRLFIVDFFKSYLYYIGFILAYLSVYFILISYNFRDISIFILLVNTIVFLLFFVSHKFFIFRDFLKTNTILFSLFYIVFYVWSFFSKQIDFVFIDFINSSLIFSFFLLGFYNDKKILKKQKTDPALVFYFFSYSYLFISFYFVNIIENTALGVSIIGAFLSIFLYYFITKLDFFKNNLVLIRAISIIFLYISSLIGIGYFIKTEFSFIIFLILIYSSYFNFQVHKKFENYISLFFSFFIPIFLIFYLYFKKLGTIDDGFIFLVLSLGVSIEIIVLTYFYKFKYIFDNHFVHIIAYITNIVSLIYYFVKFEFDFFIMGVILLFESIFVFLSYYKLKKIGKTEKIDE